MFKNLMWFSQTRGLPLQQRWIQINHDMFSRPLGLQLSGRVMTLQQRWVSNTVDERVAQLEKALQAQIAKQVATNSNHTAQIKSLT